MLPVAECKVEVFVRGGMRIEDLNITEDFLITGSPKSIHCYIKSGLILDVVRGPLKEFVRSRLELWLNFEHLVLTSKTLAITLEVFEERSLKKHDRFYNHMGDVRMDI